MIWLETHLKPTGRARTLRAMNLLKFSREMYQVGRERTTDFGGLVVKNI